MDAPRRADDPARTVYGFFVDGKTPSPQLRSSLSDWDPTIGNNSPPPVRVPPPLVQEPRVLNRSISNPSSQVGLSGQGLEKLPSISATEPLSSSIGVRGASFMSALPNNLPLTAPRSESTEPSAETSSSTATAAVEVQPAVVAAPVEQQPQPAQAQQPQPPQAPPQQPPAAGKTQKQMTKAERRELQEKQRAMKAAAKGQPVKDGGASAKPASSKPASSTDTKSSTPGKGTPAKSQGDSRAAPSTTSKASKKAPGPSVKPSEMFAHLPPYHKLDVTELASRDNLGIHPAMLGLGLQYAEGAVKGSNARCVAMLNAICQVIRDYSTPEGKSLSRDLQSCINTQINFLVQCRPLGVSMGNAIRFLKLHISKIDPNTPEHQAKAQLIEVINNFIQEKVIVADRALVEHAITNIHDGDTILIYSYSHVVLEALLAAHELGRNFTVVVVDSAPQREGQKALKKLMAISVPCTYVLITNAASVMKQVTTVFLGASAVLSNGTVISQAGTASVALMAHSNHKPVVVCCETYKFHERVQLDSIIHNELGNPDDLATLDVLKGWKDVAKLELLNLKYDALPKEYVTMVATEFGAIPASSVPVILREYRQDMVQV